MQEPNSTITQPQSQPQVNDEPVRLGVANIVGAIEEALNQEKTRVVAEMAKRTGVEPDVWLEDQYANQMLEMLQGFFNRRLPKAHQLTPRHIESHLGIEDG